MHPLICMLRWSTTHHRKTDSRTTLGQVLCPLGYLQVWPSWIQNLEYLIYEISDKLQRKVPQRRESIENNQNMDPRTGRLRDSISLGFGSAMNRIDWGISHVITGKLIIQKTLNRHHLTCRSWFDQWIPIFRLEDEIRKKRLRKAIQRMDWHSAARRKADKEAHGDGIVDRAS